MMINIYILIGIEKIEKYILARQLTRRHETTEELKESSIARPTQPYYKFSIMS